MHIRMRTPLVFLCAAQIFPVGSVVPVRMFLKASSTFVESRADVSINERVFFSDGGGQDAF